MNNRTIVIPDAIRNVEQKFYITTLKAATRNGKHLYERFTFCHDLKIFFALVLTIFPFFLGTVHRLVTKLKWEMRNGQPCAVFIPCTELARGLMLPHAFFQLIQCHFVTIHRLPPAEHLGECVFKICGRKAIESNFPQAAHGKLFQTEQHAFRKNKFFGQFLFPDIIVQEVYLRDFCPVFSCRCYNGNVPFIILVRFHIPENIVCFTESIDVIQVLLFPFLQIREKAVKVNLHDKFFQRHF